MKRRVAFTKAAIEGLSVPEPGGRAYYYDTRIPHLALCVTGAGSRTYYHYRKVNGRPVRYRIGRYGELTIEQARKRAEELNGAVAAGGNPHERRQEQRAKALRKPPTLGELFAKYRAEHLVPRGKRTKNPDSYYGLYLKAWERREIGQIRRADVQALHAEIAATKSGVTANRTYQLLRAIYNFARYAGIWKGENPAGAIRRYPERSRDRFLQPDELPRFFQALGASAPDFRDFVLLALLTGARRSNVQAMRWEDVHLERGTWQIPETKTGDPHTVPLSPEALDLLRARQVKAGASARWVFPSHGRAGHLVEPKRAWTDLLRRAEIDDLHVHDLRRTLGSWQAATGASLSVIGKTLAHKDVSTTAIYARLNLDPVRQAVNTATRAMLVAAGITEKGELEAIGR